MVRILKVGHCIWTSDHIHWHRHSAKTYLYVQKTKNKCSFLRCAQTEKNKAHYVCNRLQQVYSLVYGGGDQMVHLPKLASWGRWTIWYWKIPKSHLPKLYQAEEDGHMPKDQYKWWRSHHLCWSCSKCTWLIRAILLHLCANTTTMTICHWKWHRSTILIRNKKR